MRTVRILLAFSLLLSMVAAGSAAAPVGSGSEGSTHIVVFKPGAVADVEAEAARLARAYGGQLGLVYKHAIEGFSVKLTDQAANALERNPLVAFINENRPVWAFSETVPTGVRRIGAPTAHETNGATGLGVRVAIIDTGIDSNHEDLMANLDLTTDYDCVNLDDNAEDDQGHGTHVAGTVAAVGGNNKGVVGVAPNATLVGIKVLNSSGSGTWEQVICGIDHIAELNKTATSKIHVANMSLGGSGTHDGTTTCSKPGSDAMYKAICAAIASGTTFVVAAGNDSKNASGFVPAAYPEVITVSAYSDTNGSTDNAGCTGFAIFRTCDEVFAPFSNYGDIVDVIAPGVNIYSTTYDGSYGTKSGTSMASPHAAGVAALVIGQKLKNGQTWSPAEVEAHLRDFGQCPDTFVNGATTTSSDCPSGQWKNDPDTFTEPMAHAAYATSGGGDSGGDTTNNPPVASFTYSCTDLACNFDGSGSSDSDGKITSYAWAFGDDSTGHGMTVSHTYAAGGTYTVTLTVTDDDNATHISSQSVTVTAPSTGGFTLSATGYKVRGVQKADLSWAGVSSTNFDIYRNDSLLVTTSNNDAYTDNINVKGSGSYIYKVCEAGTSTCSNEARVDF